MQACVLLLNTNEDRVQYCDAAINDNNYHSNFGIDCDYCHQPPTTAVLNLGIPQIVWAVTNLQIDQPQNIELSPFSTTYCVLLLVLIMTTKIRATQLFNREKE